MPNTKYVDTEKLNESIERSGLKIGYLADSLGLSYQGFRLKRNGVVPFRKLEKDALVSLLGVSNDIFLD